MNCNSVKEHLVDFLYDEMSPEVRAAFAEHLHGCLACAADVASYRKTLGNARVALSGPLAQEPPARVHSAVMEAAKLAAARMATATKKAQPARATLRPEPELGFFARLLRTSWLLPAFGAASVATVVFLVRVLKNPEVLPGQRPQSIAESAEPPSEPPTPGLAPATEQPAAEIEHAKAKAQEPEPLAVRKKAGTRGGFGGARPSELATGQREEPAKGLGGLRLDRAVSGVAHAEKPSETVPIRQKKKLDGDPLSGLWHDGNASRAADEKRFAEPPPPRPAPSAAAKAPEPPRPSEVRRAPMKEGAGPGGVASRHLDNLLGETDRKVEARAPKQQVAPEPAPAAAQPITGKANAVVHAPAARSAPSPSGMSAPAAAPTKTKDYIMSDDSPAAEVAERPLSRSRAAAPAPAPAVMATAPAVPTAGAAHRPNSVAKQTADKEASPQADDEVDRDEGMAKGQGATPSLDESVRRADRLFAEQSWNAAARTYRELIRRYPGHKDVGKWRARIDQAVVAERESRPAAGSKEAKARRTGADALESVKQ